MSKQNNIHAFQNEFTSLEIKRVPQTANGGGHAHKTKCEVTFYWCP